MTREKCEAIVLSTLNYGETDKIFVLFTKQKGIITTIAKGVRKINSKRSFALDTLNLISVNLGLKNNYYFIEETSLLNSFTTIKKSILFLSFAYFILESTRNIIPENTISTKVYLDLKNTLNELNKNPSKRTIYLFLKKLLIDAGFWDYDAETDFPYLNGLISQGEVCIEDQRKIDVFFTNKIEEIGERKLQSKLLISKL